MQINKLADLNKYKTAPTLDSFQSHKLFSELNSKIFDSDWLTIGVMANSDIEAKVAMKTIIQNYSFIKLKDFEGLKVSGHVFMKGNQKTGEVYIRSDYSIGEGILITCQNDDQLKESKTYGPFPLSFFATQNY